MEKSVASTQLSLLLPVLLPTFAMDIDNDLCGLMPLITRCSSFSLLLCDPLLLCGDHLV